MSTATFRLFITPPEFFNALDSAAADLGLIFVCEREQSGDWQAVEASALEQLRTDQFYIGTELPEQRMMKAEPNMARLGLVVCEKPEIIDNALILASFGSKSDWTDEAGKSHDNKTGAKLLNRLKRRFRPLLRTPVWARNTQTNAPAVAYRGLWFSEGASAWSNGGGALKQRGVPNVEFHLADPTEG